MYIERKRETDRETRPGLPLCVACPFVCAVRSLGPADSPGSCCLLCCRYACLLTCCACFVVYDGCVAECLQLVYTIREMGCAPRNPAPRNHFLVWIVKPSGCHCTDGHLTSRAFTEDPNRIVECRPPLGAPPLSLTCCAVHMYVLCICICICIHVCMYIINIDMYIYIYIYILHHII